MQKVKDTSLVMGDGYRYRHEETGEVQSHPFYAVTEDMVKKYRRANNFPIGTNWEESFEDNLCTNTPKCPCVNADTVIQKALNRAKHFAKDMKTWALAGFPIASEEVIAARRQTCEGGNGTPRCPQWSNRFRQFGFGHCGSCGCSGVLKTAVQTSTCPLGKWKV